MSICPLPTKRNSHMTQSRDELLRAYLHKISRHDGIESLIEGPAAIGPESAVGSAMPANALKKIASGLPLDASEHFNLEAIIIPDQRPAIDIVNGQYTVRHALWQHWNEDEVKLPLCRAQHSVGRIELPGHPRLPYAGTGFVVGDGLLMTNRHVAELFCSGLGLRDLRFITGVEAGIDFLRERANTASRYLRIIKVVMVHPYWDMALLQVSGLAAEQVPLRLDTRDPRDLQGGEVAVIGYPLFDSRNPADVQQQVFDGVYGIKRLMPGFIGERLNINSYGHDISALLHDSSTLGGASGSALLDPRRGRVLGLHFAGQYLKTNYAVAAMELARDGRVVDAGVLFEGPMPAGAVAWDGFWHGYETAAPVAASAIAPVDSGGVHTFTLPLQISVSLGGGYQSQPIPQVVSPTAPTVQPQAIVPDATGLLDLLRQAQQGRSDRAYRFVSNFSARPAADDAQLAQQIRQALGIESHVGPLFEADAELDRHRMIEVRGLPMLARDDLFELARLLRDATQAQTTDPDLGSDYFVDDGLGHRVGPEGVEFPFWCWAADKSMPSDKDWAIKLIRAPEAWAHSQSQQRPSRGENILVFQPDTGVVPEHPELPAGLVDNDRALNILEPGRPPVDPMSGGRNIGHGTGTASVVVSPEQGRMCGTAPLATLVPIRCLESVAVFNQSNVAKAIDHARRQGAHVITMSLGGVFSDALHTALRKAVQANIIVVAAAGNCVSTVVWPARYEACIAVGGVNAELKPWQGSSHGKAVAISGPAEFVLRASPRNPNDAGEVSGGQGTSFATAHLAGVAALWLAHHGRDKLIQGLAPGVTLQEVFRALIQRSANKKGKLQSDEYGAGIFDAQALLEMEPAMAMGLESVYRVPGYDMREQVIELLGQVYGAVGVEVAAPVTADPQHLPELACIALDQLRLAREPRVQLEGLPPLAMSVGLRRALGAKAQELRVVRKGNA
ncbi:S8 family serine peptidase [Pseudomonas soli]|uniref:S8 family serine peptidase n=1 Tax=Pseudomonas soli TaxID=1306993 RepID=UPI003CFF321F